MSYEEELKRRVLCAMKGALNTLANERGLNLDVYAYIRQPGKLEQEKIAIKPDKITGIFESLEIEFDNQYKNIDNYRDTEINQYKHLWMESECKMQEALNKVEKYESYEQQEFMDNLYSMLKIDKSKITKDIRYAILDKVHELDKTAAVKNKFFVLYDVKEKKYIMRDYTYDMSLDPINELVNIDGIRLFMSEERARTFKHRMELDTYEVVPIEHNIYIS